MALNAKLEVERKEGEKKTYDEAYARINRARIKKEDGKLILLVDIYDSPAKGEVVRGVKMSTNLDYPEDSSTSGDWVQNSHYEAVKQNPEFCNWNDC